MKFKVNPKIFEDFDKPLIGVIIATGIDNQNDNPEIQKLLWEAEVALREKLKGVEVSEHPNITP